MRVKMSLSPSYIRQSHVIKHYTLRRKFQEMEDDQGNLVDIQSDHIHVLVITAPLSGTCVPVFVAMKPWKLRLCLDYCGT